MRSNKDTGGEAEHFPLRRGDLAFNARKDPTIKTGE
jgi:hypothetical protein